jgi:hypothetical protein
VRFLETPEFMINRKPQIESIKLLGYTEAEAQFLHLVAARSEYFLHASSPDSLVLTGAATTHFWKRLEAYGTGGCAAVRRTLSVLSAEGDEEGGGNGTLLQNAGPFIILAGYTEPHLSPRSDIKCLMARQFF